jgi:hypothetical protein
MGKQEIKLMFVKASFFFMVGVVLASLFVWSLLQGAINHLDNGSGIAFGYYFVSWLSGVSALVLYIQARGLFHYAKISN